MNGVNVVTCIGNIVKDSELTFLNDNKNVVAKFTVAVNETFKKKDDTKQELVEFFNVNFWGNGANALNQYLKKGTLVYVTGKQRTESWEKDGVKHYKTTLVANTITLLGKPNSNGNGSNVATSVPANSETANNNKEQAKAYAAEPVGIVNGNEAFSSGNQDEDDLPF
jgi:single-strand DNA-binding protein